MWITLGCSDSGSNTGNPASTGPTPAQGAAGTTTTGTSPVSTAGAAAAGTATSGRGVPTAPAAGSGPSAVPTAGSGAAGGGATLPPTNGASAGNGTATAGSSADAGSGAAAGSTAAAGGDAPVAGTAAPQAGSGSAAPQTCTGSETGKPGRTVVQLEHAGVKRSYILYVPDRYAGDKPVPLVLNFHPLLFNAQFAESGSGYKELAAKEGFIVAYPDSQESAAWNVGPCCTQSRDVDDVGFARAIVADVSSKFCVDQKRVYASGFSMGGGMSHYLACEAADVFAAVAPGAFDLLAENTCAPVRPITVISFRSQSDAIVPYAGGEKQDAPNGFRGKHTFLGAVGTFKKWAEVDGCTGDPVSESGGCQTYKQCKDGVEVTLCTVGGGHTWPDATRSWQTISRFSLP